MLANAFLGSMVVFLAVAFYLLTECRCLISYRIHILSEFNCPIAIFAILFFGNLLTLIFMLGRRLFLKDSGKKLVHLEKQLRSWHSISDEFSCRIKGEE